RLQPGEPVLLRLLHPLQLGDLGPRIRRVLSLPPRGLEDVVVLAVLDVALEALPELPLARLRVLPLDVDSEPAALVPIRLDVEADLVAQLRLGPLPLRL